jgi:cytochrome P450
MAMTEVLELPNSAVRIDDPAFYLGDPFPVYAHLRRHQPVYRYESLHTWALSKYEDIRQVSRNGVLFSSARGIQLNDFKFDMSIAADLFPEGAENLITTDPPRHRQLRRIISKALAYKSVQTIEPTARLLANTVIDRIVPGEPIEFVHEVAADYPLMVICAFLGLEGDNIDQLRRWSEDTSASASSSSLEEFQEMAGRLAGCHEFFGRELGARRECPTGDILTGLLTADIDGERLNAVTLLMFAQFLLAAGGHTSRHQMSGSIVAFAEHPEQYRLLVDEPAHAATATEELLRWVTPSIGFARTAMADTEIRGQEIRAGDRVFMLYHSANMDEEIWPDAHRLDITRPRNHDHLAFGFGQHVCMGAALSRLELRVFWEELVKRFGSVELAGEVERVATVGFNGWERVPAVFHRR